MLLCVLYHQIVNWLVRNFSGTRYIISNLNLYSDSVVPWLNILFSIGSATSNYVSCSIDTHGGGDYIFFLKKCDVLQLSRSSFHINPSKGMPLNGRISGKNIIFSIIQQSSQIWTNRRNFSEHSVQKKNLMDADEENVFLSLLSQLLFAR